VSEPGERPKYRIEEDGDVYRIVGRHLGLDFAHVGDRWHHCLMISRHPFGPRELFARPQEGDELRDSPSRVLSPVFQELQLQIDAEGRAQALVLGRSGPHHFSAAFLLDEVDEKERLSVDVADRCREPVECLASTYVMLWGSGDLTTSDESSINWLRRSFMLTFAAGPSTRLGMAETGRHAVLVQALPCKIDASPSRRWQYSWTLTP
jgi:hypothetical protein